MKLPRPLAYFFVFLLLLTLYAPALNGTPIWDDNAFIFWRFGLMEKAAYAVYWRDYIWPFFDSVLAFLHSCWGPRPLPWHLLNVALHGLNAWWCAHLVARWRPTWFWPLFIVIVIDPRNVMAVAWIIQLKTVLSATLLLATIHLALEWWARGRRGHYACAVAVYFLALATKSSVLPFAFMPLLLLPWVDRDILRRRLVLACLPFMVLSLTSAWRIQRNRMVDTNVIVTADTIARAGALEIIVPPSATVTLPTAPLLEAPTVVAPVAKTPPNVTTPSYVATPQPTARLPDEEPAPSLNDLTVSQHAGLILHNWLAYLDLALVPRTNRFTPAHGPYAATFSELPLRGVAMLILVLLFGLRAGQATTVLVLFAALTMALVPFLGFVTAPYMLYSSVAEQHLYLALPIALCLMGVVFGRSPRLLPVIMLALAVITLHYTPAFRSEEAFFQRVLSVRSDDLYGRAGLAAHYRQEGRNREASQLLKDTVELVERDPRLKRHPFWPFIEKAHARFGLQ